MSDIPPPFDAVWFQMLIGAMLGLALGSFITMLSYRLPRRLSLVSPGSHCPVCKTPLGARDLVPVLSWLAANGRCRYCAIRISPRYPLIELATALLTAAAFVLIGFNLFLIIAVAMIIVFLTFIVMQLERR